MANPQFPLYLPSKGRYEVRCTSKALSFMRVPHYIVVEEQEYDKYVEFTPPDSTATIIVLDQKYKEDYELCDDHGLTRSTGPGPARNFAWDHSIKNGFEWHWVMDDNIFNFLRLNNNLKIKMADGTCFKVMEDFVLRYDNVGMAGPNYRSFAPQNSSIPPFVTNTRIYSCNLIRNDLSSIICKSSERPFRWRGRYNEDTILSLDMLKDGWCTIQFNAFLQDKARTQIIGGGNTAEFYSNEGTIRKSKMLKEQHPDVTDLVWRFGREHHYVNYNPYKSLQLKQKQDVTIQDGINNYGMKIKTISKNYPGRI